MPATSGWPLPTVRTTLPAPSFPSPVPPVLHGFAAGSSGVPYSQSGPGSDVSAVFVTSLSPVWGFELFTAPKPQRYWSRREQRPPRSGTRNVGMLNPGWSQHWLRRQPFAGWPGVDPHPVMPGQIPSALPHEMHAVWSHAVVSSSAIVNVVLIPWGKGRTTPSAVAKGVVEHSAVV